MGLISALFGSTLEKLTIRAEKYRKGSFFAVFDSFTLFGKPVPLFNPTEIKIDKSIEWDWSPKKQSNVGESSFTHGSPQTMSLDLHFYTYEDLSESSLLSKLKAYASPFGPTLLASPNAEDVRKYTRKIYALTEIDGKLGRPPICKLSWGEFEDFFTGYLTSLSQRFTLFMPSGMPVRAILSCEFKEWRSDSDDKKRQNPLSMLDDDPLRVVRRGETLSSIAAEEYQDPSLWRAIAEANGLDNPRAIKPGQVLTIPVLRPYLEKKSSR